MDGKSGRGEKDVSAISQLSESLSEGPSEITFAAESDTPRLYTVISRESIRDRFKRSVMDGYYENSYSLGLDESEISFRKISMFRTT